MHDIKFIRDNPKIFDKKMNNRNVEIISENKIFSYNFYSSKLFLGFTLR